MDYIAKLIDQHMWVPLAAIIIALVVRLLKSDTKIPIDIPPRWRLPLAVGLGGVSTVLERVAAGTTWGFAVVDGASAVALAVFGHNAIIDTLRGGKELNIPGLIIPGATPGPDAPVTIPPGKAPTPPPLMAIFAFVLAMFLAACGLFGDVLSIVEEKSRCAVTYQELTNAQIIEKCAIQPGDFAKYLALIEDARQKTAAARLEGAVMGSLAAQRAVGLPSDRSDAGGPCPADAGPPAEGGRK